MSDSVHSTASSNDNMATGQRVLKYALSSFVWGMALASAWACSSVVLAIIVFIAVALLLELCTMLLAVFFITPAMVHTVGDYANRATARVTSLFSRKATA